MIVLAWCFSWGMLLFGVLRPVLTASRPSQTIAQMGPLSMSRENEYELHSSNVGFYRVWVLTGDEAFVEGLAGQVLIVLLEVLFRRADELHSYELISVSQISYDTCQSGASGPNALPALLKSGNDVANESSLSKMP